MQLLAPTAVSYAVREAWTECEGLVTDLAATKLDWEAEDLKTLVVEQLHQAKSLAKANFGVFNTVSFFRSGGIPRGFPPVLPLNVTRFQFVDPASPAGVEAAAELADDSDRPFTHLKPVRDLTEIGFTVAQTEAAREVSKCLRDVDDELLRLTTNPKDEKDRVKNVAVKLRNLSTCTRAIVANAANMTHPSARLRLAPGVIKETAPSQYPSRANSEATVTYVLDEQANGWDDTVYGTKIVLPVGVGARTETLRRLLGVSTESGSLSEGEAHNRVILANVSKHMDMKSPEAATPLSALRMALVIACMGEEGTAHDFLTEIAMRGAPTAVIRNRATIRALCSLSSMRKAAAQLKIPDNEADKLPLYVTPLTIGIANAIANSGRRQLDGLTALWGCHVVPVPKVSLNATLVNEVYKTSTTTPATAYDMTELLLGTLKGVKTFKANDWIFASTALAWDLNARLNFLGVAYDSSACAEQAIALGSDTAVFQIVSNAFEGFVRSGAAAPSIPTVPFKGAATATTALLASGLAGSVTNLRQIVWRVIADLLSALDAGSWATAPRLVAVEKAPQRFDAAAAGDLTTADAVLDDVTAPGPKGSGPVSLAFVRRGTQHFAVITLPSVCKSPLVMTCRDAYIAAAVHQCVTRESIPFLSAAVRGDADLKPCATAADAALRRMAQFSTAPL